MKRKLLALTLTIAAAAALAAAAAQPGDSEAILRRTVVRDGVRVLDERYEGLINPSKHVILIAPQDGVLGAINVAQQDRAHAEDVLVQMDDKQQELVVQGATLRADSQSAITIAGLALEEATLEVERAESLFRRNAITEWELRQKKVIEKQRAAELEQAQDEQRLAKSNLALEQERLRRFKLTAPFDGTIMKVIAEQGAVVSRNDQILVLANLDVLEAEMNLPIQLYGKLEVGKTYRLRAGSPVNAVVEGKLKSFAPARDAASDTFPVTFEIQNPYDGDKNPAQMPLGFSVDLVVDWIK